IILPRMSATMKSRNLNWEMERCPITFATKSKKIKLTMPLKIHWMDVSVSWLSKKSNPFSPFHKI
ncbi:hypothetical protein M1723_25145, partial [Salmonella enterica subsp. enterica serovar Senftenberg]